MNKTLAFVLVTAALGTGSVALAHPGKRLERLDTNKDGKVTQEEMKTESAAHFAQVDTNKDGRITKEEAQAFHEAMRREHAPRHADKRAEKVAKMQERGQRHFAEQDANGDGAIDRAEHEAGAAKRFARMDENADGAITPEEMKRGPGHGGCPCGEEGSCGGHGHGEHGKGAGHGKGHGHGRGGAPQQGAAGDGAER